MYGGYPYPLIVGIISCKAGWPPTSLQKRVCRDRETLRRSTIAMKVQHAGRGSPGQGRRRRIPFAMLLLETEAFSSDIRVSRSTWGKAEDLYSSILWQISPDFVAWARQTILDASLLYNDGAMPRPFVRLIKILLVS